MRRLLFILLLFCGALSAECISCEELENASDANILTSMDEDAGLLEIYVFYENLSVSPSRQPVNDFVLLVQMSNSTGLNDLYRVYTDGDGAAIFDFNSRKSGCINFKILYCPFCDPASPVCGFEACTNYSNIETTATSVDDIPLGLGASSTTIPSTLNQEKYMPAIDTLEYCPPPAPMSATPALCLPLIIIISLLSGSLFLTGRNPFAGFNIGGMKVGKHIRYQARGRGYSFSGMAALSALVTVGSAIKTARKGKGALAKSEKAAAKQRVFGYSGIKRASKGVKAFRASLRSSTDTKSFTQQMNARVSIRDVEGSDSSRSSQGQATSQGMAFLPGGGGVRGSELMVGDGLGLGNRCGTLLKMALFVATQTTVGRLVDGFVYIHADQGMFEALFVDHDQRRAEDMQAALSTIDEETGGVRMNIDGREVVVLSVTRSEPNAEGETHIESMEIVTGEQEGRAGNTTTLLLNEDAQVVGYQFQATGLIPEDQRSMDNPDGIVTVTIRQSDEPHPQGGTDHIVSFEGTMQQVTTAEDGTTTRETVPFQMQSEGGAALGQMQDGVNVITESAISRTDWAQLGGEHLGGPSMVMSDHGTGIGFNQDASDLTGTYETIMGNPNLDTDDPDRAGQRAMLLASARSEAQRVQTLRADDMTDDMNTTDRATARARSSTIASDAQHDLFGAHDSSIYAGLPQEDSPHGGQRTVGEVAAVRAGDVIADLHAGSDENPVSIGRPNTVVDHALEGSDLGREDRGLVAGVISGSSPAELESMDRTTLRNRIVEQIMVQDRLGDGAGAPPLTDEQRTERMTAATERANGIMDSIPAHADDRLREVGAAATEGFRDQFSDSPELARRYASADISALASYAGETSCLGEYEHNIADLIGRDPTAYSSDVVQAAMEYRAITGTLQQIDRIRTADPNVPPPRFPGGDRPPSAALDAAASYAEMNRVYVETVLVGAAAGDADTAAERQAADLARQGVDHLYQQANMAVNMQDPSQVQIEHTIAAEREARERIRTATEAGDVQTAVLSAMSARQMHETAGNEYAVHMYDRILEHYGVTFEGGQPRISPQDALRGDSLGQNVDISLRVMPPPEEVARRYARVSQEAHVEERSLATIGAFTESHDYGSALAAAADRARYFRRIGDDARAGQYSGLVSDISRVRSEYRAAMASGGGIDETERAALERSRAEISTQLGLLRGGAPLEPDQAGPTMPGAADTARRTLDRRWQHMGLGHEALIQASGRDRPPQDDPPPPRAPPPTGRSHSPADPPPVSGRRRRSVGES